MSKAEEAIEKLARMAEELYQCRIEARINFLPVSKMDFIEVTGIKGSDLFVILFCAQFPDEIDGFPVYLSEQVKNDLYDSSLISEVEN